MRKYVVDADDDDERVMRDVERRLLEGEGGLLCLRKDGDTVYIVVCMSLQVSSFMAGALRQCRRKKIKKTINKGVMVLAYQSETSGVAPFLSQL
jgi:hypothetical protein